MLSTALAASRLVAVDGFLNLIINGYRARSSPNLSKTLNTISGSDYLLRMNKAKDVIVVPTIEKITPKTNKNVNSPSKSRISKHMSPIIVICIPKKDSSLTFNPISIIFFICTQLSIGLCIYIRKGLPDLFLYQYHHHWS